MDSYRIIQSLTLMTAVALAIGLFFFGDRSCDRRRYFLPLMGNH